MLNIIIPIFLVILTGFIFAKKMNFSKEAESLINSYVLNIALPALLFLAIAQSGIKELLNYKFLIMTLGGIFIAYILGILLAYIKKIDSPNSAIVAMSTSYGTTGYMGVPMVIIAFGTVATVPAAIATILHNIPVIITVIITFAITTQDKEKKSIIDIVINAFSIIVKNPLVIAVSLGFVFVLFNIKLPEPMVRFSNFLGSAAGPTALFAIGISLSKLEIIKQLKINNLLRILPIVFIKIIIQPFSTFVIGYYLFHMEVNDIYFKVALLMSALPVGAGAYVFSNKYNYYEKETSFSIVISLIITIFTLGYLLNIL